MSTMAEREHLLLAAREVARRRLRRSAELGEQASAAVDAILARRRRVAVANARHGEVLRDGRGREHAAAAGELHDAESGRGARGRRR